MQTRWFSPYGSGFVADFAVKDSLILDNDRGVYQLYDVHGTLTEYSSSSGVFLRHLDAAGNLVEVVSTLANGFNFTEVQRSFLQGGVATVESYLYSWNDASAPFPVLTGVLLRRKVGSGSWENVQRTVYTYYAAGEANGSADDLKTATRQTWDGSAWQSTGTSYYRYWTGGSGSSSSSSASSGSTGSDGSHLLRFVVKPASYARMVAAGLDPLAASNAVVAGYADYYFEYDASGKVTSETVDGGAQSFGFDYETSAFSDGYNRWKTKTTETQADGSRIVTYSNYAGQTMLRVLQSGSDQWLWFFKYDNSGFLILQAESSAVSGFDEQYADLLHEVSGNYQYLRDNDGLIRTYSYHAPSGFLASESLQRGELGSSIKLREYGYVSCCESTGSSSSSSSSGSEGPPCIYFISYEIVYPSDVDPGQQQITTYAYEFYAGTCALKQRTTTYPVVPLEQNGSGVAAFKKEYYDEYGNLTWQMDERGFLTRTSFDIATKAVTQVIRDVDTALVSDAPPGWVTPAGGGLHLISDYEHDDEGRTTQVLGPSHTIDLNGVATVVRRANWTVYQEATHQIWSAQGYATGTEPSYSYHLVNPVSITKMDADGRVLESIQATRASEAGKLQPTDSFPQPSYVRWTTTKFGINNLPSSHRTYKLIPPIGQGSSGLNYDESLSGYDLMLRRNRTVTPRGTITRTVFDVRNNAVAAYVGTDDTGATDNDPTGGGAPGNNMVVVSHSQFDGGLSGGDNNLTQTTQHVDASTSRVTQFLYDWRDRRTDADGEIDSYQIQVFDNLDRVIRTDRRNTTSSGTLVARSTAAYDARGRVYQTVRYGVDPNTGAVGSPLTDNTWFDEASNTIKSQPAGSSLFTKTVYDGLRRVTIQYQGYDLSETGYPTPADLADDTIFEQKEAAYDAASNAVQTTSRMRYHDATGTGPLGDPSSAQPKARVTYTAQWQDGIGRTIASADYGTNGGTALVRPYLVPYGTDWILVSEMEYSSAGDIARSVDPSGMVTCMQYDAAGRETVKVLNCDGGSSSSSSSGQGGCPPSDDALVRVLTAYNADGNVSSITAVNRSTGDQLTQYVYGTTLSDSDIASSQMKRYEVLPDSTGGSDRLSFAYNRQGEVIQVTDQNGTVHAYDYDLLGRKTQDRVTVLGTGVDGAVRRIATTYEVRGMVASVTSYDNAAVGSGSIVNQDAMEYDEFGQLVSEAQSHSGVVTGATPKVQYAYEDGSANTIRQTAMTYPNGRVLSYSYGASGGDNDALSRVQSLVDDNGTTHLAIYSYLGLSTFIETEYAEPTTVCTLVGTTGGIDPDTGDIYRGFDRFGRVKDLVWNNYTTNTDLERVKHGYDRVGNRIWRMNPVDPNRKHDEYYWYDGIHRLKDMERGTLNGSNTAISSPTFAQCWSLDATGNWERFREDDDGNGNWDLIQSRVSNPVNEITAINNQVGAAWAQPVYDAAGNTTTMPKPADPTTAFDAVYDAWNRLVEIKSSGDTVTKYQYDGQKRRKTAESYASAILTVTRHCYYTAQWQNIEERLGAATDPDRHLVWGVRYIDDLILRDRGTAGSLEERLYALQDPNWNVTAIIAKAAEVNERYAYSAYGLPTILTASFLPKSSSDLDWCHYFVAYDMDGRTYIYNVRNRLLHVYTGHWQSRDPLGTKEGTNLYEYAFSDPLNKQDPSGLSARDFVVAFLQELLGLLGGGTRQDIQACAVLPVNPLLSLCAILSFQITGRGCCVNDTVRPCGVLRFQADGGLYATGSLHGMGRTAPLSLPRFPRFNIRFSPNLRRWRNIPFSHNGPPIIGQAGTCPPDGLSGEICFTISAGFGTWTLGARACYNFSTGFAFTAGLGVGHGTGASVGGALTYRYCL
ncbi:MAG: hypothetical protein K2X38_03370 [Gemmataceae bacterium]|nr:hypothetical protein [Gemmataceae bacterium]